MAEYRFMWRTIPDPAVLARLRETGISRPNVGGLVDPEGHAKRVLLEVDGDSEEATAERIRSAIVAAGGEASSLEPLGCKDREAP